MLYFLNNIENVILLTPKQKLTLMKRFRLDDVVYFSSLINLACYQDKKKIKNVSISYQPRLREEIMVYAYAHHFKVQSRISFLRGPNFKVLMERLFLEA